MQILIASSISPFTGREEIYWTEAIAENVKKLGYQVDTFMLPVVQDPLLIPEQIAAVRLLDIANRSDLLITIGYPAFVIYHPRKRVLLFSLIPGLHEHFDTEYGILANPQYHYIRSFVIEAEKKCLAEAEKIICASMSLTSKISKDYGLNSFSLWLGKEGEIEQARQVQEDGKWFVTESTLEPSDRIDLLLNSIHYSKKMWGIKIFIPSASKVYRRALDERINRMGITDRVALVEERLPSENLLGYQGYIALNYASVRIPQNIYRAISSGIPIITLSDTDALLEVVLIGKTGIVIEPTEAMLAKTLDDIVSGNMPETHNFNLHSRLSNDFADVNSLSKLLVN